MYFRRTHFLNIIILLLIGVISPGSLVPTAYSNEIHNHKALASRSDSIDVLHFNIDLDMTDFSGKKISGHCTAVITPKINNISVVCFDLLKLTVDSILLKGVHQPFTHNDTLIRINLLAPISVNDTLAVEIFYNGVPVKDSYWGGFYYQGDYAYNLGVGFDADPHNYGRIWFPCFDNFVERSTYTFGVITSGGKKAHCNGLLVSESILGGDTLLRTWQMDEPIPSYLACVAVSDYETVKMNHSGMTGTIPIEIAARAPDTIPLKNSFVHLPDAIDAFETAYGPYSFSKVGYSLVPFGSGAMEHATNIAYPRYAVNGTTNSETLMAHELAHHWWGDLVTCSEAGDMWLNEGMARYSEHIFLEHTYGYAKYLEEVIKNHSDVLQYAHIVEEQYRAVSGVPHKYTYGTHVYDKGASVAHNLRAYLGDVKFKSGLTDFLTANKFGSINSSYFRDQLKVYTGVDLTDFFKDWVFNPGFPHFSIDSMIITPSAANYNVSVYIKQKLRGAPAYYQQVPMEIAFWDASFNVIHEKVIIGGANSMVQFTLPLKPEFAALNTDHKINQAITADQLVVDNTGTYTFEFGRMTVAVENMSDSALIRVEHHWAAIDPFIQAPPGVQVSDYRYWSVDGIWKEGFRARGLIKFDGRNNLSGGEGHLDNQLLKHGEDSILLFHRLNAGEDWKEYRYYSVDNLTSMSDRFGWVSIDSLQKGEYVLAKGPSVIGIASNAMAESDKFTVFPNPAGDRVHIQLNAPVVDESLKVEFLDISGKRWLQFLISDSLEINTESLQPGTYIISVSNASGSKWSKAVVIQ